MILLCCASELGLPEDLSAIEVILYYYYYYVIIPAKFIEILAHPLCYGTLFDAFLYEKIHSVSN